MLFKEGIEPMWEDKTNKNGGRWLLNLDKNQKRDGTLDNSWMETLMCLIGEIFEDGSDDICGAVAQNRGKGDKISIWTKNAKSRDVVYSIGQKYKEKLQIHIPGQFSIQYQVIL
jgi:translation initiation factor 4E